MRLSPCIEWHFADEHPAMAERIRATKAAGFDHAEFHLWRDKDIAGMAAALAQAAGVTLLLEPLNDRVEHPGMFLVSTTLGLDIVEAVGSPNLRLLFDVYHSATMGEDLEAMLSGRMQLVGHVQVADQPGRNEPGTGSLDWPHVIATLRTLGYDGALGLEYRPTMAIDQSLALTRKTLGL